MTSIDSGSTSSYAYNALGQRVEKKVGSAYTEFMFGASLEPVGENNRTSWSVSMVPFAGRHVAHYQGSATYFMHGNRLGSTSQATDYSGAMSQDQLYYPWGQEWNVVGTAQEKRFASLQHRDAEASLDPTQFRLFSSTQGRWLSTDPARGCGDNPQNLNRYTYVANSPTNRVDPNGDFFCYDCPPGPLPYPYIDIYYYSYYCNPYYGCYYSYFPINFFSCVNQLRYCVYYALRGAPPYVLGFFPCVHACGKLGGATRLACLQSCVATLQLSLEYCSLQFIVCLIFY